METTTSDVEIAKPSFSASEEESFRNRRQVVDIVDLVSSSEEEEEKAEEEEEDETTEYTDCEDNYRRGHLSDLQQKSKPQSPPLERSFRELFIRPPKRNDRSEYRSQQSIYAEEWAYDEDDGDDSDYEPAPPTHPSPFFTNEAFTPHPAKPKSILTRKPLRYPPESIHDLKFRQVWIREREMHPLDNRRDASYKLLRERSSAYQKKLNEEIREAVAAAAAAKKAFSKIFVERRMSLTPEELNLIRKKMRGPPKEVLSEIQGVLMPREDFQRFYGTEWLSDECVNFYMKLIDQRQNQNPGVYPDCHLFNSFFYFNLMGKESGVYTYSYVRRWTRRFDLFKKDKIIIPVHLGNHWTLCVINFMKKRLEYYDSMGGINPQCRRDIRRYMNDEHKNKKERDFDFTGWTDYTPGHSIPQQNNAYDCGVFACRFAECVSRDADFNVAQADMPLCRQLMMLDCLNKKLTV